MIPTPGSHNVGGGFGPLPHSIGENPMEPSYVVYSFRGQGYLTTGGIYTTDPTFAKHLSRDEAIDICRRMYAGGPVALPIPYDDIMASIPPVRK